MAEVKPFLRQQLLENAGNIPFIYFFFSPGMFKGAATPPL